MSSKPRAPRKSKKTDVAPVQVQESVPVPVDEPVPTQVQVPVPETPTAPVLEIQPVAEELKTKEKKTRVSKSKKTPPVVAIVTPTGITGSFMTEQRPLIAHLPVNTTSLNFGASNLLKYDPNVPDTPRPYDSGMDELSYLEGFAEGEGVTGDIVPKKDKTPTISEQSVTCKLPSHYSEKLMVLFQDSNRYNKLPEKTETACFWCCHSFNTTPFAIPSHILAETWHMYGNFCSPECATAYLFKERIDNQVQWERYALLNSLYSEDAGIKPGSAYGIRPAPPREVLRMFGGSMDISEFRAVVHEKKLRIDVLTPPMVSIIQTMDTKPIDFYDQNLKNVFIRNDIQHKYDSPGAQGLRLRRSKPTKTRETTVEWAMQIQHAVAQN